jgi:ABC-type glycerol-3-phosphate transport system permease component
MSSGDKRPITTSLANLSGQYFTDNNLIAAASVLVALPTIMVFALLAIVHASIELNPAALMPQALPSPES